MVYFKGIRRLKKKNWDDFPMNPSQIDAVLITHAHIDHTGYLPLLVKKGYTGPIYATKGTYDLCKILLPDSGHLQEEDADYANKQGLSKHKPALPLYTEKDAKLALEQFESVDFNHIYEIKPGCKILWLEAGHILGAAMISIKIHKKIIVFTGDIGRAHDPIMNPPYHVKKANYLVMEATYGDTLHDDTDPKGRLEKIIKETVEKKGTILIPAFAVGRAQLLLYYLCMLKKENKLPNIPIYLDSPMAINATDLMCAHTDNHTLAEDDCRAVCLIPTYTTSTAQSKELSKNTDPKIIISASGMLEGGRILHHVKKFGPDANNTIILTGYQAPGTRGYALLHGADSLMIHGEEVPIKARVENISSLSAHADYQEILDWLGEFEHFPKKIFVTHAEKETALSMKKHVEAQFDVTCVIPHYGDEVDLD